MKTFNRILFPTDFSPNAKVALQFAIEFAKTFHAHLILLHAFKVPIREASVMASPDIEEKTDKDYELMAQQQVDELVKHTPELRELSYNVEIRPDFPVECILNYVKNDNIDLIIMGTHGATGLKKYFLGSNTENVIANVDCPVLAVPNQADYTPIKSIGFAYDYKEIKEPGRLEVLKHLAEGSNSEVHVLTVVSGEKTAGNGTISSINKLDEKLSNIEHYYDLQFDDKVEEGIYKYMDSNKIDLLTVLPRKHGFFESLLNTSITKKLINHSQIPILVL